MCVDTLHKGENDDDDDDDNNNNNNIGFNNNNINKYRTIWLCRKKADFQSCSELLPFRFR
jgi:hypothetical protein